MKNGTKSKKAIKRGIKHHPVDYMLKLSFEIQQSPELGAMSLSGGMTLPIRRGAIDRLGKHKKEDIAAVIRQIAEAIEKGDPSVLGHPDIDAMFRAAGKGKAGPSAN